MSENIQFKTGSGAKIYPNPYWPIGSIYLSVNETNPSVYFGGKWEQIAKGRTLVGVDKSQEEFKTVKKTGGEKMHKLTVDEMPSHNHNLRGSPSKYNAKIETAGYGDENTGNTFNMDYTGGDQPHNNMPPYFTCFIWIRTA